MLCNIYLGGYFWGKRLDPSLQNEAPGMGIPFSGDAFVPL